MSVNNYSLCSVDEAVYRMAKVFDQHTELQLEVFEDKCFEADSWLSVGKITISPAEDDEYAHSEHSPTHSAMRLGQYNWDVPTTSDLEYRLNIAMNCQTAPATALNEAIQDIVRRLCLMLPTFDLETLCSLPLKRPITVAVDTSSVLQGGLDFVARFLYPKARIKVPAVVPLEILSMADNFLGLRRDGSTTPAKKAKCLREHIKSQGGQRALLRMEWHSDIEIERPIQGSDPLRMIFDKDKDPIVSSLNLTTVQRSYADRFVYESAKEHQSRLSPGHSIRLLTSDQGLARMALAEGMQPMYFEARRTPIPFGKKLTGTLHNPFKPAIYSVPLTSLLWELATCFGSCRLQTNNNEIYFRVSAMAEDLAWYPYQSKDDLLWCSWSDPHTHSVPVVETLVERNADKEISVLASKLTSILSKAPEQELPNKTSEQEPPNEILSFKSNIETARGGGLATTDRIVGYIISPAALLRLVAAFSKKSWLGKAEILQALDVTSDNSLSGYKSFLTSGDFVQVKDDGLEKTAALDELWIALLTINLADIRRLLCQIPSFVAFLNFVEVSGRRPDWIKVCPMRDKATIGYKSLSEISAGTLSLPNSGICATFNRPDLEDFCEKSLEVYKELSDADAWVLTGEWLEQMAWSKGIHPLTARELLSTAHSKGMINRYFEGSTPDTGFAAHTLDVLERSGAVPILKRYQLYQGDFISEEKASVRIKIERVTS